MPSLVVASHDNDVLDEATLRLITAASGRWGSLDALVAGCNCRGPATELAAVPGVTRVLIADSPSLREHLAEPMAHLLCKTAASYDAVLAVASNDGRDFLPRTAALLDVAQVSDVEEILAPNRFRRVSHSGRASETTQSAARVQLLTVRASTFAAAPRHGGAAMIHTVPEPDPWTRTRVIAQTKCHASDPRLEAARRVIGLGRGVHGREQAATVTRIAKLLDAAIGGTRPAVECGLVPDQQMLGQSGKVIFPDLYIAVGVSGAPEHMYGVQDSAIIVSINNDPRAPIVTAADFCLVGDLADALPELERELTRLRDESP